MPTSVFQGLAQDTTLQQVRNAIGPGDIYEVDTVSTGAASAGTIILSFSWNGITWTTPSIAYNAVASAVQTAVQAATGAGGQLLPANSVVASGGPLASSSVTLTFQNQMVGTITNQLVTPTGLTGGTATFTRTTQGNAGGMLNALSQPGGGTMPAQALALVVRGSDGKMYAANGIGVGDGSVALQTFVGAASTQGNLGSGAPLAAYNVAFRNSNNGNILQAPNMDASGAFSLQSAGTAGGATPSKVLTVGGTDSGGLLRTLSVNSNGALLTQSSGTPGTAAPSVAQQVAGVDNIGNLRSISVTTNGAVSTQDASAVPESPLSINAVAFTLGQSSAPPGPLTVNTTSTTILPDSTGASSVNGIRGQLEIINVGNTDICISPSSATVWGTVWLLRPGGSLVTTYSGPVSAISNNTANGTAVTSPTNAISVMEWA